MMGSEKPVVFETLREDLAFLEDHLDRLFRSAQSLDMKLSSDISTQAIRLKLEETVKDIGNEPHRVKIRLSQDEFEIVVRPLELWPESIEVESVTYTRPRAETKYETEQYGLMQQEAKEKGLTEVIYVDEEGFIREGSVTNVFLVIDGVLVTPKDHILYGITRSKVIKAAQEKGIPIEEREIHQSEIEKASEIFVTNSLRGLVSIRRWGAWESERLVTLPQLQAIISRP